MPTAEAVGEEARRGYDLMIVGVQPVATGRGEFSAQVSKLAAVFEGSIAIVDTRGIHAKRPLGQTLNMLVPVTGSETSRRGAEVALTIAKSARASVATLSVISNDTRNQRQRRKEAGAVLEEIGKIAAYYQMPVETTVRADASAGHAIAHAIKRNGANVVAMGVSRRPGGELAFGSVAADLLKDSNASLVFIAPQAQGAVKSSGKGPEKAPAEG